MKFKWIIIDGKLFAWITSHKYPINLKAIKAKKKAKTGIRELKGGLYEPFRDSTKKLTKEDLNVKPHWFQLNDK